MAKKKPHGNQKPINEKLVYTLAKKWCTTEEIADMCECSSDTIERRFMHILKKARAEGKESLRTAQWKSAIVDGNVTMQIWLGKQKLGQKEPIREEEDKSKAITAIDVNINPKAIPNETAG